MADIIRTYRDRIERYGFDTLVWTNYVVGKLSKQEVTNLCNQDLRKRFQETPPFGFLEVTDVSTYVTKLSTEIKKKADEDLQTKITVVVDVVDEIQNIAKQIRDDMEAVRERAQHFLESSMDDAVAESRYFKWDEALHKDITAFKDLVQLLAGIQGKLQPTITLNVVDEKFKEVLATIRDTECIPNNMKRQLLIEIKDRIEKVRKDLVSLPPPKEIKATVVKATPMEPLE